MTTMNRGRQGPVPSASSNLLVQVRHVLIRAGFHLVADHAEDGTPGLAVTEAPTGVLVKWAASDGFTWLARDQPAVSGDSMQVIVQAAQCRACWSTWDTRSQNRPMAVTCSRRPSLFGVAGVGDAGGVG
ncbi:hypothetical protein AB0N31_31500 [Streptomyces sp. NPDC051051]|uniref:hypothetical protein n=1 Tax=Streptomyces sp. NPDC051051 TaxID=3155666 RepID=UPI003429A206